VTKRERKCSAVGGGGGSKRAEPKVKIIKINKIMIMKKQQKMSNLVQN
jgi:hypothetical protein